jgi:dihydroflavonol-4-reductase
MVLVTGGTGFLGAHLLLHLIENEENVTAIYRNKATIAKTESIFKVKNKSDLFNKISWLEADILQIPSLEPVFQNIDYVYHCAGLLSFDRNDEEQLRKINVEGTANIVNLCLHFKIKKLCYVSSIAALGDLKPNETELSETSEWNPEKVHSDYAISKYGAEMEIWRGQQEGLNVLVVNPGVIIGDWKATLLWNEGSGKILQTIKSGISFYTNGSTGFVTVYDVVKTMRNLMNSVTDGERFCLVGENLSFKEFIFLVCDVHQLKKPSINAKPWMIAIFLFLDWIRSKIFNQPRKLHKSTAVSLHSKELFSNEKAAHFLNYEFELVSDFFKK